MPHAVITGEEWCEDVPRATRWPLLLGSAVLLFGVFGFGVWASVAPIDGAVVASGTFVATGQNKIIQHLEGGIISKILVREGDVVEAGQPLVLLDDTDAKANLRRLSLRHDRLLAIKARLEAEVAGADEVTFGPELLVRTADPEVAAIVEG